MISKQNLLSLNHNLFFLCHYGFAEALDKLKEEKCKMKTRAFIVISTKAHSAPIFHSYSVTSKKRKGKFVFALDFYGRFLSIRIASIAPIMITMIAIVAIPNSTVFVDASPVTDVVAVGALVAARVFA